MPKPDTREKVYEDKLPASLMEEEDQQEEGLAGVHYNQENNEGFAVQNQNSASSGMGMSGMGNLAEDETGSGEMGMGMAGSTSMGMGSDSNDADPPLEGGSGNGMGSAEENEEEDEVSSIQEDSEEKTKPEINYNEVIEAHSFDSSKDEEMNHYKTLSNLIENAKAQEVKDRSEKEEAEQGQTIEANQNNQGGEQSEGQEMQKEDDDFLKTIPKIEPKSPKNTNAEANQQAMAEGKKMGSLIGKSFGFGKKITTDASGKPIIGTSFANDKDKDDYKKQKLEDLVSKFPDEKIRSYAEQGFYAGYNEGLPLGKAMKSKIAEAKLETSNAYQLGKQEGALAGTEAAHGHSDLSKQKMDQAQTQSAEYKSGFFQAYNQSFAMGQKAKKKALKEADVTLMKSNPDYQRGFEEGKENAKAKVEGLLNEQELLLVKQKMQNENPMYQNGYAAGYNITQKSILKQQKKDKKQANIPSDRQNDFEAGKILGLLSALMGKSNALQLLEKGKSVQEQYPEIAEPNQLIKNYFQKGYHNFDQPDEDQKVAKQFFDQAFAQFYNQKYSQLQAEKKDKKNRYALENTDFKNGVKLFQKEQEAAGWLSYLKQDTQKNRSKIDELEQAMITQTKLLESNKDLYQGYIYAKNQKLSSPKIASTPLNPQDPQYIQGFQTGKKFSVQLAEAKKNAETEEEKSKIKTAYDQAMSRAKSKGEPYHSAFINGYNERFASANQKKKKTAFDSKISERNSIFSAKELKAMFQSSYDQTFRSFYDFHIGADKDNPEKQFQNQIKIQTIQNKFRQWEKSEKNKEKKRKLSRAVSDSSQHELYKEILELAKIEANKASESYLAGFESGKNGGSQAGDQYYKKGFQKGSFAKSFGELEDAALASEGISKEALDKKKNENQLSYKTEKSGQTAYAKGFQKHARHWKWVFATSKGMLPPQESMGIVIDFVPASAPADSAKLLALWMIENQEELIQIAIKDIPAAEQKNFESGYRDAIHKAEKDISQQETTDQLKVKAIRFALFETKAYLELPDTDPVRTAIEGSPPLMSPDEKSNPQFQTAYSQGLKIALQIQSGFYDWKSLGLEVETEAFQQGYRAGQKRAALDLVEHKENEDFSEDQRKEIGGFLAEMSGDALQGFIKGWTDTYQPEFDFLQILYDDEFES